MRINLTKKAGTIRFRDLNSSDPFMHHNMMFMVCTFRGDRLGVNLVTGDVSVFNTECEVSVVVGEFQGAIYGDS